MIVIQVCFLLIRIYQWTSDNILIDDIVVKGFSLITILNNWTGRMNNRQADSYAVTESCNIIFPFTGELIGVESPYSQSNMVLPDTLSQPDLLDNEIDEGIQEDPVPTVREPLPDEVEDATLAVLMDPQDDLLKDPDSDEVR